VSTALVSKHFEAGGPGLTLITKLDKKEPWIGYQAKGREQEEPHTEAAGGETLRRCRHPIALRNVSRLTKLRLPEFAESVIEPGDVSNCCRLHMELHGKNDD
jgi:hypothetical protein